jgi:hypothetical protein
VVIDVHTIECRFSERNEYAANKIKHQHKLENGNKLTIPIVGLDSGFYPIPNNSSGIITPFLTRTFPRAAHILSYLNWTDHLIDEKDPVGISEKGKGLPCRCVLQFS